MPASRRRSKSADPAGAAAAPAALPAQSAPPPFTAKLVPLDPGFYAFSLAADTGWRDPRNARPGGRLSGDGLALPAIQICAPPHQGEAVEITDSFGRAGSWLGGRHRMLFVKSPSGGAALVTAYLARDPDSMPLELEIRRVGAFGPATIASESAPAPADPVRLSMGGPAAAQRSPPRVSLEIVAHIRGRGDVRFVDAPWIGRLGAGSWIEALTIVPHDRLAAAAIEYKGLTASGAETPWLGSGSPCGTQGRGIPLIGFAVRQKAGASGALFDCEYTGYFRSGAIIGPARNGAPCRSATNNDPLEGLQLRIIPRPARPASAEAE